MKIELESTATVYSCPLQGRQTFAKSNRFIRRVIFTVDKLKYRPKLLITILKFGNNCQGGDRFR